MTQGRTKWIIGGVLLLVLVIASIGMATDFELAPDQDEQVKAAAPQPTTMISEDQAKAAALTANPGTMATGVKLEKTQGKSVYDVALNNNRDISVDATNGHVLRTEPAGMELKGDGNE